MLTVAKWQEEDYQSLTERLLSLADQKYRAFNSSLVPGVEESNKIIGVRLPLLRAIAKEIARGDAKGFLRQPRADYYEEIMVEGLVIGYLKEDFSTVLSYIRGFVPKINNWAVCDSFVTGLHMVKKHRQEFYTFLNEYLHSDKEYHLRFAIVSLLDYYLDSEYIDRVLEELDAIRHQGYYVKMAVAWTISAAYVKERKKTRAYLSHCNLDDWTYNKALQKIVESNRVPAGEKAEIKAMKRKK